MMNKKAVQCNAKAKTTGSRCRNMAVTGSTKCRMHGGKTPRGPANANWQHGRYSKYAMPEKVQEKYIDSLNDRNLLGMRDEIALINARIATLVEEVTGEGQVLWFDLDRKWQMFRSALVDGDQARQRELLAQINDVITTGTQEQGRWKEMGDLFERKRRMVDSERNHLLKSELMISIEQLTAVQTLQIQQFREVLIRNTDRETMLTILRELSMMQRQQTVIPSQLPNT